MHRVPRLRTRSVTRRSRQLAIESLHSRRLLAADLVQFANDLTTAGARLFTASWCQECTDQVQEFEDGQNQLTLIEVTGPDRQLNDIGQSEQIDLAELPVWEWPDGTTSQGVLTLAEISLQSGVEIPQSDTPSFQELSDQTVLYGSPLHLPIDAYDPKGDPLTVSISVADPDSLAAVALSGNRSIRVDLEGFGDLVFELFEQRAPRPAGRVIELAEADFYDNVLIHRIEDDFVIQTGDPTINGGSASQLGTFDDQFHPDLQHNRAGVLSFAKPAIDDSNNSQFFVTEQAARPLDFNHSVFGQLVEGEAVREAISEMDIVDPGSNPPNQQPAVPIVISSIDVFDDTENSVIMLKALTDEPTTTSVTITVTNSSGLSFAQTIDVTIAADTANSQPFLLPITVPTEIYVNQVLEIQLESFDIEDDMVLYNAGQIGGDVAVTGNINRLTGEITLTPEADKTGVIELAVVVEHHPDVPGRRPGDLDRQVFTINVIEVPPYHRVDARHDVDGLNGVSALDALLIINAMGRFGGDIDLDSGPFPGLDPELGYNVNGDQKISALDALQVINAIDDPSESESIAPQVSVAPQLSVAGGIQAIDRTASRDDKDRLLALLALDQLGLHSGP